MDTGGANLLTQLDKRKITVEAALWNFSLESGAWRLIFASPEIETAGPRKVYRKIQMALRALPAPKPDLSEITVVSSKEPFIEQLKRAIKTGKGLSRVRLTRCSFGTWQVADALVYRST
jgi:hypothetical protein